jgi:hypothetical protein
MNSLFNYYTFNATNHVTPYTTPKAGTQKPKAGLYGKELAIWFRRQQYAPSRGHPDRSYYLITSSCAVRLSSGYSRKIFHFFFKNDFALYTIPSMA